MKTQCTRCGQEFTTSNANFNLCDVCSPVGKPFFTFGTYPTNPTPAQPNEQGERESHPPECDCNKCETKFLQFIRGFEEKPSKAKELLELSEALNRDLFKRCLNYEQQLAKANDEIKSLINDLETGLPKSDVFYCIERLKALVK